MVRYQKNIKGGIMRVPKVFQDAVGDEVELMPNKISMVVYPKNADPRKVIRSMKVIIADLEQDVEDIGDT